jgi:hypothetical protein
VGGEEQLFLGDPDQVAILASFNVHHFRRLKKEELEYINDAYFEHSVEISRQWAGRRQVTSSMAAEWQRMRLSSTSTLGRCGAWEKVMLAQNEDSRK